MLLGKEQTRPRVPRILIVFPLEGKVVVEFACRRLELSRLIDDVIQDDGKAELLERSFDLIEERGRA
jgi:hypothetical protein